MKFLIVGDLHGKKPRIYYSGFDAIVAPGDFCSDIGIRNVFAITYREFLKNPYHYKEWWDIVGRRKAKRMIKRSLSIGRKILECLNSFNVPVYIVPGNWDWTKRGKDSWIFLNQNFFKNFLIKDLKNIFNLDGRIKDIGDYQILGYGKCSGPELYRHRHYGKIIKEKDILKNKKIYGKVLKKYHKLFRKVRKPLIFLSHNVPFNTSIDKIKDEKSLMYGRHYGSLIVRKMIEKYQPLVCIGGHMHEYFGKCNIKKTVCINVGFGPYVNTWLELEGNNIKKLEFYRGK